MGPYAEEICVLPGRQFAEHEKDFAIAFAVPGDAEGIIRFVLSPEIKALEGEFSACHGKKYLNKEAMIVFENVFVPWERVFLCGESQYAGRYADFFATVHRFSYCACKPAVFDLLSGAAALISEYNGTEGKYLFSDSKGKLFEILKNSDMIKGMGQAAIKFAKETDSGAVLPDPKYANIGKFISGEQFPKAISILQDMAGSLPVSLPHENLLKDKEYGPKVKKVFARKEGITPEDHYRLNELIRTIAASDEGGLLQFGTRHGGGTVEVEKATIYTQNLKKLQQCKKMAKRQAGIS
jgi:4-hydroxyphenylacetate 3-monooxygenase/4-hydroxybutyryl-CoA dehydratase/vinylacetyl-CoA-Delta-isomerase